MDKEIKKEKPEVVDLEKEPDAKNIVRVGKHATRIKQGGPVEA